MRDGGAKALPVVEVRAVVPIAVFDERIADAPGLAVIDEDDLVPTYAQILAEGRLYRGDCHLEVMIPHEDREPVAGTDEVTERLVYERVLPLHGEVQFLDCSPWAFCPRLVLAAQCHRKEIDEIPGDDKLQ